MKYLQRNKKKSNAKYLKITFVSVQITLGVTFMINNCKKILAHMINHVLFLNIFLLDKYCIKSVYHLCEKLYVCIKNVQIFYLTDKIN